MSHVSHRVMGLPFLPQRASPARLSKPTTALWSPLDISILLRLRAFEEHGDCGLLGHRPVRCSGTDHVGVTRRERDRHRPLALDSERTGETVEQLVFRTVDMPRELALKADDL